MSESQESATAAANTETAASTETNPPEAASNAVGAEAAPAAADKTKEEAATGEAQEAAKAPPPNQALVEAMEKFRALGQKAFVLGASGEVGKEVVKELCKSKIFSKVAVIGRRELKYEDDLYKEIDLEQKIVNFDELESKHEDDFKGYDVGYCCLGTTKGKAGVEGFKKVDHDYVVSSAKLAKAGGCKHFNLVTSQGTNKNSMFLYPKTKGLCEEHVQEQGFQRFSVYRPGMLLCDREEKRTFEAVFRKLVKPMEYFAPTWGTAPTVSVAKAMINNTVTASDKASEILTNKDIRILAGDVKK
ncbi:oxidoreductase HTATIP2-like [Anneissia japonica]|uniref:oxidoreductase HTATIP2-like n=1 Tax=Anneissia japonica TaxID=1529436 RepID=UPI0014254BB2|nr:oxidoreductase HTATIP2-like [Anneissia japonica]